MVYLASPEGNNSIKKKFTVGFQTISAYFLLIILNSFWQSIIYQRAEKSWAMVFCYQNSSEPTVRKRCSSNRENLWKFEAEGQEFSKILRSLEQFVQTAKGHNNFW